MKFNLKLAGLFSPAFLLNRIGLHPATKIFALVLMAACIQALKLNQLLLLGLILLNGLIYFGVGTFASMIWRMRWLFLSMTLIYAFATPGEYIPHWPMDVAPTYEGLKGATYQIARMTLVLAGIALLIATSSREALMAGIYFFIQPLRFVGLSPARFTARLYLTLQYIDDHQKAQAKQVTATSKWAQILTIDVGSAKPSAINEKIRLDLPRMRFLDYVLMAILFALVVIYR